jgi:hypothetical protein
MHVEQMILSDLMEQVIAEKQIWNNLDRETQLKIIAIWGDLIGRTVCKNNNISDGGVKNERS